MIEHLRRALETPYGVVVETDNPELCRAKLYAARTEDGDTRLWELAITRSPESPSTQVWIVRKKTDDQKEG